MSIADKLTLIAENEQKVYEAGKKAEYDKFWDALQVNGTRTRYENGFFGWDTGAFYPKYDIVPTGNMQKFMQYFGITNSEPIDFAARLEECGVKLDTSKATNTNCAFYWNPKISRLPEISLVSSTNTTLAFSQNDYLVTIDKVIFSDDGTQPSAVNTFLNMGALQNITIEGVIGNTVNFQASPLLTAESVKSIITHLKVFETTDAAYQTKYVYFNANAWARVEEDSTAPDGGTWKAYVQSLGWNI